MCMEIKPRTPQNLTIFKTNDELKKFLEKKYSVRKNENGRFKTKI